MSILEYHKMRGEATKNVKVNESFKYFLLSVNGEYCFFRRKCDGFGHAGEVLSAGLENRGGLFCGAFNRI